MNILSGFNLFVRQALLYPLASPFLPAVADVKKDVSYANGELVGTLEAGPVELVWQSTIPGATYTWANAVIYSQYLEADGVTVSETPQNIWTLPTQSQLVSRLSDELIINTQPPVFQGSNVYWSSNTYSGNPSFAWNACGFNGTTGSGLSPKSTLTYYVRCVR